MIETIWPLSVLSRALNSPLIGPDETLIGLRTFVQEVLRRSKTSYSTLQVALYYLILIKQCIPSQDFTVQQLVDSPTCRAMQCGRRMFLTALILASKYLQDRTYSARAWSKISGLRTSEINANEMAFLAAIEWKLHVPESLFNRWTDIVLKYSPASSTASMSPSPSSARKWKSIIRRISPELDWPELALINKAEIPSHLSRYKAVPSALTTPPPEFRPLPFFEPNEQATTDSYHNRKGLELTLRGGGISDRPILPPPQCPGLLPTPAVTPHPGILCAPAVSAYGACGVKSSMSAAMSQVQNSALARSIWDTPAGWKAPCHASIPSSSRRSSLGPCSSTLSSPESMLSDVSSRRSRSSSISSVASSTCALPRPRLAVQATRRCAQMKLSSLREGDQPTILSSPPDDSTWEIFHPLPDDSSSIAGGCFCKAHPNSTKTPSTGLGLAAKERQPPTKEATAGLYDDALCNRLVNSNLTALRKRANASVIDFSCEDAILGSKEELVGTPGSKEKPCRAVPCSSVVSRKRERPLSAELFVQSRVRERPRSKDLSVQSRVRELIAPGCLGDITSGRRPTADDEIVLPDPKVAEPSLMLNQGFSSWSNVNQMRKNLMPRKKTCGVKGTRENSNVNQRIGMEGFAGSAPSI